MGSDSDFENDIINWLRRALADAEQRGYQRGVRETMDKIQSLVMSDDRTALSSSNLRASTHPVDTNDDEAEDNVDAAQERKRAPKGLVRKVITRALEATPGLTPTEIEATAQGDLEKMIRASSFRGELRKGRKDGLYREDGGRWFLAEREKAEDGQSSIPSAFGITTERG